MDTQTVVEVINPKDTQHDEVEIGVDTLTGYRLTLTGARCQFCAGFVGVVHVDAYIDDEYQQRESFEVWGYEIHFRFARLLFPSAVRAWDDNGFNDFGPMCCDSSCLDAVLSECEMYGGSWTWDDEREVYLLLHAK